jgi:hypothetical protein
MFVGLWVGGGISRENAASDEVATGSRAREFGLQ